MMGVLPSQAAYMSGLQPNLFVAFKLVSEAISLRTASRSPFLMARKNFSAVVSSALLIGEDSKEPLTLTLSLGGERERCGSDAGLLGGFLDAVGDLAVRFGADALGCVSRINRRVRQQVALLGLEHP